MSRRPVHLRRSWLFVGAADERALAQASNSPADACIQEFEDFCTADNRAFARSLMADVLDQWKRAGKLAAVRINPLETEDGPKDLAAALKAGAEAILLPKTNRPEQVDRLIAAVRASHSAQNIEIIPNIEQAEGLENAFAILSGRAEVTAALVASEDMCASLNAPRLKDSPLLNYVRERFHVSCCAAGITSIDMPYIWTDNKGAELQAKLAKDLGMGAKSTVNSDHCQLINEIFTPTDNEAEYAKQIVSVFEEARARGEGQVVFDGVRLEVPVYLNAKQLVTRYDMLKSFEA